MEWGRGQESGPGLSREVRTRPDPVHLQAISRARTAYRLKLVDSDGAQAHVGSYPAPWRLRRDSGSSTEGLLTPI